MSYSRHRAISKPPPGCFVNWTHPLSLGLVGCWLFNDRAGSRLADISVGGNHGVLTGMDPATDWVGSPRGGCLDFDGSSDYVLVGTKLDIAALPLSFSSWIKPAVLAGYYNTIFAKRDGWAAGSMRFQVDLPSSGRVRLAQAAVNITFAFTVTAQVWTHLVIVATTAATRLYVNGGLAETLGAFTLGTLATATVRIGDTGGGDWFIGQIDDIHLYNRELSAVEANQLYSSPYANILSPSYRRYFIPAAGGGLSIPVLWDGNSPVLRSSVVR